MLLYSDEFPFEVNNVKISPSPDLTVRVVEYHTFARKAEGDENEESRGGKYLKTKNPFKATDFEVTRSAITAGSEMFETMLKKGFKEAEQSRIELHEDRITVMDMWFRILHHALPVSPYKTIDRGNIWHMLVAAHKYRIDPASDTSKNFFGAWYRQFEGQSSLSKLDYTACQELLYPCLAFDYAHGFKTITQFLCYNGTKHIIEKRPEGFNYDHLRLPSGVIQQINAAKGRLKTILHRGLYKPIEKELMEVESDPSAHNLFQYEKALFRTGAWPIESTMAHMSMDSALAKLKNYDPKPPANDEWNYGGASASSLTVIEAVAETSKYFDGLCLDCMDGSQPKFGDSDEDYWNHAEAVKWDDRCRFRHGQPTWYFSFMGRRDKMIEYQKKRDKERDDRYWDRVFNGHRF